MTVRQLADTDVWMDRRSDAMDRITIEKQLTDAAIAIGAKEGIHAITSRRLSAEANVNQYYIYRVFDGVQDIICRANLRVNQTVVKTVIQCLGQYDDVLVVEEKRKAFFHQLWDEMKVQSDTFLFCLRYYFSAIFPKDYATEEIKEEFKPLVDKMMPYFRDGIDIVMILLYLLETVLKDIVMVTNGTYPDNADTEEKTYQFLFGTMSLYLKNDRSR